MKEYKKIMELYYDIEDKNEYSELHEKYVNPQYRKIMKSESFRDVDVCAAGISANSEMIGFIMGFRTAMGLIKEC